MENNMTVPFIYGFASPLAHDAASGSAFKLNFHFPPFRQPYPPTVNRHGERELLTVSLKIHAPVDWH
jgi:hypothetical protein